MLTAVLDKIAVVDQSYYLGIFEGVTMVELAELWLDVVEQDDRIRL